MSLKFEHEDKEQIIDHLDEHVQRTNPDVDQETTYGLFGGSKVSFTLSNPTQLGDNVTIYLTEARVIPFVGPMAYVFHTLFEWKFVVTRSEGELYGKSQKLMQAAKDEINPGSGNEIAERVTQNYL